MNNIETKRLTLKFQRTAATMDRDELQTALIIATAEMADRNHYLAEVATLQAEVYNKELDLRPHFSI